MALEFEDLSIYISSVSPITLTILSVQGMAIDSLRTSDYEMLSNAYWIGFGSIFVVTAFLGYRLKLLKELTRARIENPVVEST